jgi:hypothetical protein
MIDTNTNRVFESEPFMAGLNDLVILHSISSSSIERTSNISSLELGEVNVPTYDVWSINISCTTSSWLEPLSFNSFAIWCLLISVESPNDCRISAAVSFQCGYLVP